MSRTAPLQARAVDSFAELGRDVFLSDRWGAGGEQMYVCVSRGLRGGVTAGSGMRLDPERRTDRAVAP